MSDPSLDFEDQQEKWKEHLGVILLAPLIFGLVFAVLIWTIIFKLFKTLSEEEEREQQFQREM